MRLAALALASLGSLAVGCTRTEPPPPPPSTATGSAAVATPEPAAWSDAWLAREGQRFLGDPAYRRAALEASLANPRNTYSQQRLESYGHVDRGWDALPVWNPRSVPIGGARAAALARGEAPAIPAATAPLWDGVAPTTQAGWVELGRRVFFGYPMRAEVYLEWGLTDPARMAALGVERTPDGALPGLVEFANIDGATRVGITCALCHSAVRDDRLVEGAARRRFDYGALRLAYFADQPGDLEPELARRMATWGPGRADVTEDNDEDPVAIPDLFGLRHQAALTQAGTIAHASPLALAIRQDTQLTHSNLQRIRPPRELAWALAMYVYSLAPPPPDATWALAPVLRGAQIFDARCRSCHASPAYSGRPIPVARVGTDPALANGHGRGTGTYRVPPLLDVARGAPYLHHGAVASLDELLSPARLEAGYRGGHLGPGAIPGHAFGTGLADADRRDLISYLRTL